MASFIGGGNSPKLFSLRPVKPVVICMDLVEIATITAGNSRERSSFVTGSRNLITGFPFTPEIISVTGVFNLIAPLSRSDKYPNGVFTGLI